MVFEFKFQVVVNDDLSIIAITITIIIIIIIKKKKSISGATQVIFFGLSLVLSPLT